MPPSSELTRVMQELYALPPEEFTAARAAAEKAARGAGDRELAAAIKGLRRPSVAAWAVNQLVRERAELAQQVIELGAALRQAQADLQGEALRELTRQRRQLVAAVTTEARRLAAEHGQQLSDAAARQVEETLQAAMADPDAGQAVLRGALAQPLSSTGLVSLGEGFGAVETGPGSGSVSGAEPGEAPGRDSGGVSGGASPERPALSVVRDEGRARRKAEKRVEQTRRALKAATKEHRSAQKRRDKAEARVLQLEAELDELRRRVAELEEASEAAAERLEEEQAALEGAAATLADIEHAADAAAAALQALPPPPPGG